MTFQVIGIVATPVYTAVLAFVVLKLVDALVSLRVDADEETQELDPVLHDERVTNSGGPGRSPAL